jgi:hypothetical protein
LEFAVITLSKYAAARLAQAFGYPFGERVTAYITNATFVSCCCVGVIHRHIRSDWLGQFQDGHRVRTSDVLHAEQRGLYWVFRTASGSFYVIVSFDRHGGRQSLQTLLKLRANGVHATPRRFQ